MRVPLSWLRDHVDLPPDASVEDVADAADHARPQAGGASTRSVPTSPDRSWSDGCSTFDDETALERQDDPLVPGRRR